MPSENIDQNVEQLKENKKTDKTKATQEPQKITIELYKYKTLIDALEDRHKVKRVVLTIFLLGILLFAGITVITLSIKRLYPYSDITTNGLGATTIKSEKNEVSYWLFNTANLWANSGISVTKGDIITIRASGKSHTAIHHLLDDASKNIENKNKWVGSEGEPDEMANERDRSRRKFRIFPDMPSGALLMQVVQNDKYVDIPKDGNPDNFYFIGKERQHIYINSNGTLYFAVNDIVLNRATIANMMWENIRHACDTNVSLKDSVRQYLKVNKLEKVVRFDEELHLSTMDSAKWMNSIKYLFDSVYDKEGHDIGKQIGEMGLGHTHITEDSVVCELSYYYGDTLEQNKKRKTVWFDDNIGSFLIVVEKMK